MVSVIKLAENYFAADEVTKRVGSLLTDWNRKKSNDPLMGAFDRNRLLTEHEHQFVTSKFKKWSGDAAGGAAPATLFPSKSAEPVSAEKQVAQLRKESSATIAELKRAHQAEMEAAAAAAAERIAEIEAAASEAKAESERIRRNAESRHNTALNKLNAEIQKQSADKIAEFAELKKAHQAAMAEVQSSHRALLEAAKSGSSSVQADFNELLARKSAEHQAALNDSQKLFQQQLAAKNATIAELQKSNSEAISSLKEQHAASIADMAATYKKQLSSKSGGLAELQESHDQATAELKAAQKRLIAQKQAELEALEAKRMQDLADLETEFSIKLVAEKSKFSDLESKHIIEISNIESKHVSDSEAMVQENADLREKCDTQASVIEIHNRKWYRNLPSEYDLVNMVSNVFAGFGLWNMFGYIGLMVSMILIFIFKGINKDMKNGNSTADVYALTGVIAIESVYGYVHYVFFSDTLKAKEHLGFDYGTVAFIFAFLLSAGSFYAAFMTRNRTTDAVE